MADPDCFAALVAAIRAELNALAAEDADAILAATAAKDSAIADVQSAVAAGASPPRDLLEEARALNAEAALRSRAKMLSVHRRLEALTGGVGGAPAALVYGPDGRWA